MNKDKDDESNQKQQQAVADAATNERAGATATVINVPTKTEDGGTNEQQRSSSNQDQDEDEEATATATVTARPDAFQAYSDNDTRMLTLLGLEPPANPNDGEQENWRQLIGFTGVGEERRRHPRDDENGETPRRTRLSFELHHAAFAHMWLQRGELNLAEAEEVSARQEQEEGQEQDNEDANRQGGSLAAWERDIAVLFGYY